MRSVHTLLAIGVLVLLTPGNADSLPGGDREISDFGNSSRQGQQQVPVQKPCNTTKTPCPPVTTPCKTPKPTPCKTTPCPPQMPPQQWPPTPPIGQQIIPVIPDKKLCPDKGCGHGQYCHPWTPWHHECHTIDAKCGKQEVGIEFCGYDIKVLELHQPEECCDACFKTRGCEAYTFVSHEFCKGTCYLKNGKGQRQCKEGAVSAKICKDGWDKDKHPWQDGKRGHDGEREHRGRDDEREHRDHDGEREHRGRDDEREHPDHDGEREHRDHDGERERRGRDDEHEHRGRDDEREHPGHEDERERRGRDDEREHPDHDGEREHPGHEDERERRGRDDEREHPGRDGQRELRGHDDEREHPGHDGHGLKPKLWGSCGNPQIGIQGCPDTCYCHPWDVKFFQCIPKPDKCSKLYPQTYFDGDDITTVYGLNPWDCCKKCRETKGCKAYTFIHDNTHGKKLPACFLKRGNGQKRFHKTAVSALLD